MTTGKTKITTSGLLGGMFNGDFFKPQSIVSKSDIEDLTRFNEAIKNGTPYLTAIEQEMRNSSETAQNLAKSAKGAAVDINNIPKASKAAEVGLKALSVAGNMLLYMAIAKGIQWILTFNERLEESRQEMIETGREAAQLTEDLNGLVEQYRKLGADGKLNNSDRDQAKNIQEQINSLLGDEASRIDLSNGKYEHQLKLLRQIQHERANENYAALKDAKEAADESLRAKGTGSIGAGFNEKINGEWETDVIKKLLSKEGFSKYFNDAMGGFYVGNYYTNSAEDFIDSYNDMLKLRTELSKSYSDEIKKGGKLYDFYENLDKKIKDMSDAVTKYKDAIDDYNINEAVIQFNETDFGGVKGALIDTKEEMVSWAKAMVESEDISDGIKENLIGLAKTYYPDLSDAINEAAQALHKKKYAEAENASEIGNHIKNLDAEADQCGLTKKEYIELISTEILFNNTNLNITQKVSALQQLAYQAGITADKMREALMFDSLQKAYDTETYGIEAAYRAGRITKEERDARKAQILSDLNSSLYEGYEDGGDVDPYIPTDDDKGKDNTPDYEDPTEAIINRINLRANELEQQEEYIQNALEIAEIENDYEKQISLTNGLIANRKKRVEELNKANAGLHNEAEYLRNSNPWDEDSWFNSQGEATEAYYKVFNSAKTKEEQEKIKNLFESLSKYKKAYMDNAEEIVGLNKEILQSEDDIWDIRREIFDARMEESEYYIQHSNDFGWENGDNEVAARKRVLDWIQSDYYKSLIEDDVEYYKIVEENRLKYNEALKNDMEDRISDIEDYIDARNTYNDWDAYGDSEVKAVQRITKIIEDEYNQRLISRDEYIDKLEEQSQRIYSLGQDRVDKHLSDIDKYIDARNFYNDWDDFGDTEINAIEKQLKVLKNAYRLNLISYEEYTEKFAEYTQKLYSVAKDNVIEEISKLIEDYEEMKNLESSQLGSQKTLLQSYYDVTNAIAEAQHEINNELKASMTMYEYLNEETRELLFNQEDYNILNEELLEIQSAADALQKQYQEDILNASAETIAEITSQYQMQYETMMKQYEIAKAELDIAKKRQQLDNVLAERNTRMFINGQWQWVAKTQDVINAQNELAEAEINKKKQEASLEQTEAINTLTAQINGIETDLAQVREKWSKMQEMLNGESDEVAKALKEISEVSSPELKRVIEATGGSVTSFSSTLSESTTTLSDIIDGDRGLGTMSTGIGTIITDLESYSNAIKALTKKINSDYGDDSSSSGKTYKVNADGKAPTGLKVGDKVVTAGGTYEITGVNSDGSYKSEKVSNTTTDNYKGSYANAPSGSSSGSSSSGSGSSSSSSKGSSSSSSGKTVQVGSDGNAPSGTKVGDVVNTAGGSYLVVPKDTPGSTYNPTSGLSSIKIKEKNADGTRYTSGGLTLMGEDGEEFYIPSNGRFIPINQPTIGNIGAGGVVFNREQMANLRTLWDWSNLGNVSPFVSSSSSNKQSTVIDNSIHINGLTISEQGNEDWINGLRRYVATHK